VPTRTIARLASGPERTAPVRLECEVKNGRYLLFVRERSGERRPILLPAATAEQEVGGYSRKQVLAVALIAGFTKEAVERAIRRAAALP